MHKIIQAMRLEMQLTQDLISGNDQDMYYM